MSLKRKWGITSAVLSLGILLIALHPLYLKALGNFLIALEPLSESDALVVLDGDYPEDERFLHAVQLWQQGLAPKIILSAKLAEWMTFEDYPGWRHAMKIKNLPSDIVFVAGHDADSTKEEAEKLLSYLRKQGIRKVIVVTSNYHTRRAKNVFEEAWKGSDIQFTIAAAAGSEFHPDEWWRHRSDSRTFFYEFSKILWYTLME